MRGAPNFRTRTSPPMPSYKQYRDEWTALYTDGLSTYEIADQYDCSPETVRQHLKAAGVDTSPPRVEDRLWDHVDTCGECWEWQRQRDEDGYGRISVGGIPKRVHRVVMELDGHDIEGLVVRHRCHNPACCRPEHLELGTQLDNIRDRAEHQRHGMLTAEKVQEARTRVKLHGERNCDVAAEMGVTAAALSLAVRGETWADVPMPA